MTNVPLIPSKRPVPQVLLRTPTSSTTVVPPVPPVSRKKGTKMATKKKSAPAKFEAFNTEDITKKPVSVQKLWQMLDKMDPDGDLFTDDKALIVLDGEGPEGRGVKDLKLTPEEIALIRPYGVYDGPEPDNQETATGVVFTVFYMVELAYALGARDEAAKVTSALTSAASDVEDDDEDFDDEAAPAVADEEMDEVDDEDDDDDDEDDDLDDDAEDEDEDEDEDE